MSILDDLFDRATGVFNKVLDYDLSRLDLELAREARASNFANEEARRAAELKAGSSTGIIVGGVVAVGVVIALFFATRR